MREVFSLPATNDAIILGEEMCVIGSLHTFQSSRFLHQSLPRISLKPTSGWALAYTFALSIVLLSRTIYGGLRNVALAGDYKTQDQPILLQPPFPASPAPGGPQREWRTI